jgi:hypothetical protein
MFKKLKKYFKFTVEEKKITTPPEMIEVLSIKRGRKKRTKIERGKRKLPSEINTLNKINTAFAPLHYTIYSQLDVLKYYFTRCAMELEATLTEFEQKYDKYKYTDDYEKIVEVFKELIKLAYLISRWPALNINYAKLFVVMCNTIEDIFEYFSKIFEEEEKKQENTEKKKKDSTDKEDKDDVFSAILEHKGLILKSIKGVSAIILKKCGIQAADTIVKIGGLYGIMSIYYLFSCIEQIKELLQHTVVEGKIKNEMFEFLIRKLPQDLSDIFDPEILIEFFDEESMPGIVMMLTLIYEVCTNKVIMHYDWLYLSGKENEKYILNASNGKEDQMPTEDICQVVRMKNTRLLIDHKNKIIVLLSGNIDDNEIKNSPIDLAKYLKEYKLINVKVSKNPIFQDLAKIMQKILAFEVSPNFKLDDLAGKAINTAFPVNNFNRQVKACKALQDLKNKCIEKMTPEFLSQIFICLSKEIQSRIETAQLKIIMPDLPQKLQQQFSTDYKLSLEQWKLVVRYYFGYLPYGADIPDEEQDLFENIMETDFFTYDFLIPAYQHKMAKKVKKYISTDVKNAFELVISKVKKEVEPKIIKNYKNYEEFRKLLLDTYLDLDESDMQDILPFFVKELRTIGKVIFKFKELIRYNLDSSVKKFIIKILLELELEQDIREMVAYSIGLRYEEEIDIQDHNKIEIDYPKYKEYTKINYKQHELTSNELNKLWQYTFFRILQKHRLQSLDILAKIDSTELLKLMVKTCLDDFILSPCKTQKEMAQVIANINLKNQIESARDLFKQKIKRKKLHHACSLLNYLAFVDPNIVHIAKTRSKVVYFANFEHEPSVSPMENIINAIYIWFSEIEKINLKIKENNEKIPENKRQIKKDKKEIEENKEKIVEYQGKIDEFQKEIKKYKKQMKENKEKIEEYEEKIKENKEEITRLGEANNEMSKNIAELEKNNIRLKNEIPGNTNLIEEYRRYLRHYLPRCYVILNQEKFIYLKMLCLANCFSKDNQPDNAAIAYNFTFKNFYDNKQDDDEQNSETQKNMKTKFSEVKSCIIGKNMMLFFNRSKKLVAPDLKIVTVRENQQKPTCPTNM